MYQGLGLVGSEMVLYWRTGMVTAEEDPVF